MVWTLEWAAIAPAVTPLPKPITSTFVDSGWSSSGRCPDSSWVVMSPSVLASVLALTLGRSPFPGFHQWTLTVAPVPSR